MAGIQASVQRRIGTDPGWSVESLIATIDVDAVLRGQGLDPVLVRARDRRLIEPASRAITCAEALLEPRAVCAIRAVDRISQDGVQLSGGGSLTGPSVAEAVGTSDRIAIVVCTIGERLEREVASRLPVDPLLAMALDGVGNAAMLALSASAWRRIDREASVDQRAAGPPFSPGMDGWPLESGQAALFQLVNGAAIGVELRGGVVMQPVKSVSMIIGLGPGVPAADSACDRCAIHARCRYATRATSECATRGCEQGEV